MDTLQNIIFHEQGSDQPILFHRVTEQTRGPTNNWCWDWKWECLLCILVTLILLRSNSKCSSKYKQTMACYRFNFSSQCCPPPPWCFAKHCKNRGKHKSYTTWPSSSKTPSPPRSSSSKSPRRSSPSPPPPPHQRRAPQRRPSFAGPPPQMADLPSQATTGQER